MDLPAKLSLESVDSTAAVPGMVLPTKSAAESIGAAAKLLAVAQSTSAKSTNAAPDCDAKATTVQAAARGMLARQHQHQREAQRSALAGASNLQSLGRPVASLPNLGFVDNHNASCAAESASRGPGALEQLVDVD